jgi:RimJ/RimL family protein N-acetyltransferase
MSLNLTADRGLVLRCWQPLDAPAIVTAFADPVMTTQTDETIASLDAATAWIDDCVAAFARDDGYCWAVVDDDDRVLGSVTVSSINHRHRLGWVSYWTMPASRGRGVASAATRRLAQWAFDELDLFRLELGHRVSNPSSCRVARSAGFVVEGIERGKLLRDGRRFDIETHARLQTDPEPAPTNRGIPPRHA